MVTEAQEKNRLEMLLFCSLCFATDENGSWGGHAINGHCFNCGAGGSTIKIPRWAAESIRAQASWVGRRYYPNQEDRENYKELRALRSLPKTFPGRTAQLMTDRDGKQYWWVSQVVGKGKTISQTNNASSAEEAIEATRYTLPYVPETEV